MKADRTSLSRRGFTLLELILAATILALFVLPILEIVAQSRIRAIHYTRDRILRDLAQRKLFDRMYFLEVNNQGTFEAEGYPDWTWEIPPAEIVSQGSQTLLQYTIWVRTPQRQGPETEGVDPMTGQERPAFEMSVWTFPSEEWYAEQEYLESMGFDTGMGGGLMGGSLGY